MSNQTVPRPPGPRPPVMGRRLAIFDLDRTLLPGSSLVHLGRVLARLRVVPPTALVEFLGRELVFHRRGLAEPGTHRLQSRLLSMAEGVEYAPPPPRGRTGRGRGGRAGPPRRPASGSSPPGTGRLLPGAVVQPQELVSAVAAGLELDRGVGTRTEVVEGRLTGRLDGPLCHSDGKLARLRDELGVVDLRTAVAYSDAATDLPLLRASGHAVAVNPDRRLRAEARATGWPILDLSGR